MNGPRTFRALVVGTCISVVATGFGWIHIGTDAKPLRLPVDNIGDVTPPLLRIPSDAIDSLATAISDHDPFRLTREPSTVAYMANLDGAPAPPPPPQTPPLVLSGIIGPPWVAVLDGVPTHEGSLLAKVGDTVSRAPFALLTIRAIRHDTVIVRGADTTWTLMVRHVWR